MGTSYGSATGRVGVDIRVSRRGMYISGYEYLWLEKACAEGALDSICVTEIEDCTSIKEHLLSGRSAFWCSK